MTIRAFKTAFENSLSGQYASEEIQTFFYYLCEDFLGYQRFEIFAKFMETLDPKVHQRFKDALDRLKQFEPIQYILGHTEFYGLPIAVNRATLIPIPETEELVEWILMDAQAESGSSEKRSILDIGTGSGCIAIALGKHLKEAKIIGMDVSSEAYSIAARNAQKNNVELRFMETDVLNLKVLDENYDIIVSNPPYARNMEKSEMRPNVINFEPDQALYVPDENPLLFYQKIMKLAQAHLKVGGRLYLEINEYLSEEMLALAAEIGFVNVVLRKDFAGKFRMLKCLKDV